MKRIATYKSTLPEKFGVPRQSGLAPNLKGTIVFEKEYSNPEAFDGLEQFERIWIIWKFDVKKDDSFRAKVRPPRLGGNTYMGVFATRSPFRPNHLGLTCVKIDEIRQREDGLMELVVSGADMMDGTEIYDVKPYIPYADAYPDVKGGFAQKEESLGHKLEVKVSDNISNLFSEEDIRGLMEILSLDPRPSYQNDPDRIYGLTYAGRNIKFKVANGVLEVIKAV